ncbi:hypothetical protein TN53_39670 [Streptomyces sp. WM6386]|nr:hypothetical protein TN53_39670 [Streptomyces sp. WM6386]
MLRGSLGLLSSLGWGWRETVLGLCRRREPGVRERGAGSCCLFLCLPRGGWWVLGGMIRRGGSRLRRRGSCGAVEWRRAWSVCCGNVVPWLISRGSIRGSGWRISRVRSRSFPVVGGCFSVVRSYSSTT